MGVFLIIQGSPGYLSLIESFLSSTGNCLIHPGCRIHWHGIVRNIPRQPRIAVEISRDATLCF